MIEVFEGDLGETGQFLLRYNNTLPFSLRPN